MLLSSLLNCLLLSLSLLPTSIYSFIVVACYPQIFIPCVTTVDEGGKRVFGKECYAPENRVNGLQYPIATNKKVDKVNYIIII